MRRGHVLVVGTLVIVAVTAGSVMFLPRAGSSAPTAGTTTVTTATTAAGGGYCIVYPYDSREPYGNVSIIPDGTAALCDPALGHGPAKAGGRSARATTASRTGYRYCIEDTVDNRTWNQMFSGHDDFDFSKALNGSCPG